MKENKDFLKCKSFTCAANICIIFSLQSINLKPDDIVIIPSINFIASYNVAKLFNAKVFLADVDYNTGQILHNVIDLCNSLRSKIKAIILMYNGGYPDNAENFKV